MMDVNDIVFPSCVDVMVRLPVVPVLPKATFIDCGGPGRKPAS